MSDHPLRPPTDYPVVGHFAREAEILKEGIDAEISGWDPHERRAIVLSLLAKLDAEYVQGEPNEGSQNG